MAGADEKATGLASTLLPSFQKGPMMRLTHDELRLIRCALHVAKHAWGDRPSPFKKQAVEAEALEERFEGFEGASDPKATYDLKKV